MAKIKESFDWSKCITNFRNFIDFECEFCPDKNCKKAAVQKRECYYFFLDFEIEDLKKEG